LDGCCDHRAIPADEELHRHAADILNQADALLFAERQPAVQRGLAMTLDDALAYALASEPAESGGHRRGRRR